MHDSTSNKLIIPGMAGIYDGLAPYVYPFVRFIAGAFIVPHGYMKLFGGAWAGTVAGFGKMGLEPATFFVGLVGGVEFFGGIMVALGLLTRIAAAACAIDLIMATILVHASKGFFGAAGGWQYVVLWAVLFICIWVRGGGKLSLDRALGREF